MWPCESYFPPQTVKRSEVGHPEGVAHLLGDGDGERG